MKNILDFLTDCFHEGYEYNTIAGFSPAIFAYHNSIQRVSVGQNDRVVALFSGIFNDRPTQPKFDFICDVRRVLDFIITLECDRNLSLKQLTLKLTMLLVLTSATRTSEINLLDLRF